VATRKEDSARRVDAKSYPKGWGLKKRTAQREPPEITQFLFVSRFRFIRYGELGWRCCRGGTKHQFVGHLAAMFGRQMPVHLAHQDPTVGMSHPLGNGHEINPAHHAHGDEETPAVMETELGEIWDAPGLLIPGDLGPA
jgi:hypothetical protein